MKTTFIAAALILAGSSFGVKAEADGDNCSLNRPFQVLNAQTNTREWNRVRGSSGWCKHSDYGIGNDVFLAEGPSDSPAAEASESPDGGSEGESGSECGEGSPK